VRFKSRKADEIIIIFSEEPDRELNVHQIDNAVRIDLSRSSETLSDKLFCGACCEDRDVVHEFGLTSPHCAKSLDQSFGESMPRDLEF
jgi:hypothetical protein